MSCCGNANVERKKWEDGATPRINRLRDQYWKNLPEMDAFRALVYTRVYKETEAEDLVIRHAKALLAYMTEKPIVFGDDELIIGTEGVKHRSAVVCPEICFQWIKDEMDTMATRPQDPYQITEETKKALKEVVFPYWEGKSLEDCGRMGGAAGARATEIRGDIEGLVTARQLQDILNNVSAIQR